MRPRIGFGFDVHQLKKGHPFWLGGIKVEHDLGAFGHSDADVLIHAICDALLGAAALGDIGKHFPNNAEEFKGIDSKELLKRCMKLINGEGFEVGNVDCTLCLEKPKILPYVSSMVKTLCPLLKIGNKDLSIKATTNETLGYVGREEGVCAYASAIIFPKT